MAIPKIPGEAYGATIRLTYRGPGDNFWVGFGLRSGSNDYYQIPASCWIGKPITIPLCLEESTIEVSVSGVWPAYSAQLPSEVSIDTFKVILKTTPNWSALVNNKAAFDGFCLAKDRDDEVYHQEAETFDISTPESTYF